MKSFLFHDISQLLIDIEKGKDKSYVVFADHKIIEQLAVQNQDN